MRTTRRNQNNAFTLIEIMIVVTIIGILLAIALPNFARARETTNTKSCVGNLRAIRYAKDAWAMERNKDITDTPTDLELFGTGKYISRKPECPSAGTYSIQSVNSNPTCSIGGTHDLAAN